MGLISLAAKFQMFTQKKIKSAFPARGYVVKIIVKYWFLYEVLLA